MAKYTRQFVHVYKHVIDIVLGDLLPFVGISRKDHVCVECECDCTAFVVVACDPLRENSQRYTKAQKFGDCEVWELSDEYWFVRKNGEWWKIMKLVENRWYEDVPTYAESAKVSEFLQDTYIDWEDLRARVRLARSHRAVTLQGMFEKMYLQEITGRVRINILNHFMPYLKAHVNG